ncbi:MAG: trypsin-like peptidase domain-containing protein [Immundisolibacteraceae bacterium]|nr:trypsin-like peptidase domain-containing protein [Immundisolibacteraceae bacterium]
MSASPLLRFGLQATIAGLVAGLLILWAMSGNDETISADQPPLSLTRQPWQTSFNQAVKQAGPGVVNIYSSKTIKRRLHPLLDNPLFQQFFGGPQVPRERIQSSLGSGVLVSADGYVLTNNHVIAGADEIKVALNDGRSAQAQLIGSDPGTDLALLEIDLPDLTSLKFGQSDQLLVGDVVLAIGNPFGVGQTVTMGIVSATGRQHLGINTFEDFIQTDAAINPGNSGGALVNPAGELVGINTAIYSQSGGSQGIGFAVPAALAQRILDQLVNNGRVVRGWLGLELQNIDRDLATSFGLKSLQGVIVAGVYRNTPAHQLGLRPGDIITAIDGINMNNANQALNTISGLVPEQTVAVTFLRRGKQLEIELAVIERPKEQSARRR